ncbi:3951_t:CDS:2, partial [Funneliformis caledonium]
MYNTQTSTQKHYLNSVHKEFEKEKLKQLKVDDQIKKTNGEGFLCMINKLNPAFKLSCYVTIKKDIGYEYQAAFQAIKEMITHTCDIAAITTDLWTSHAKSDSKVNVAITENCSNMIKAIHEWDGVNHIPCDAYTLQLCVIKG